MCGRVAIFGHPRQWAEAVGADWWTVAGTKTLNSYNVTPGRWLPVFQATDRTIQCYGATWGPYFRIQSKWRQLINTKIESILISRLWQPAWKAGRRGLLVVDGWYEWVDGQPYYLTRRDREPLLLAALYGLAPTAPAAEKTSTMTIVTRPAAGSLREVHSRQPLLIPDRGRAAWLSRDSAPDLARCQKQSDIVRCEYWPVSKAVNNPKNDRPELIHPVNPGSE